MKTRFQILEPYLYIAPYFVVFVLFLVAPAISGMVIGFYDWPVVGDKHYLGLGNFQELFGDPMFIKSVLNTLEYSLMYMPIFMVGGLLLALLLNRSFIGKSAMRMIIYAPYVFMIPAIGVMWRWFLDTNYGILNYYLGILHLGTVKWLSNPHVALKSIVMVISWEVLGYSMVIFLAGLQEIPAELYEAAEIDGASPFQKFWRITLPFLRPTSFFLFVIGLIGALKTFGQPLMITAGGPLNSSMTVVMALFFNGFKYFRMGYAAAISALLFFGILIVTLLQFRLIRQRNT